MMDADSGSFLNLRSQVIYVPVNHFAAEAISRGAIPEQHVDKMLQTYIRPGQTVVDIGANIGFHTLTMSSAVQNGKVYAVEADIENVFCLSKTLHRNGISNTQVFPVAASDAPGVIHMATSEGTNSIFSPSASASLKSAPCVRLDDYIHERISLAKIDIEGAELLALRGMSRLLASRPILIMEFSPGYIQRNLGVDRSDELLTLIFGLGYYCHYIAPDGATERLIDRASVIAKRDQAFHQLAWGHIDLLCVPSSR